MRGLLRMRKLLGVFLALGTLLSMVLVAAPAGAVTGVPNCKSLTGTETWSPALPPISGPTASKKVNSTVKLTAKYSGCSGVAGITSGTSTSTSVLKASNCTTLIASLSSKAKPTASTGVVKWNNGQTTTGTTTLTQISKVGASPVVLKDVQKSTKGVGAGHTTTVTIHAVLVGGAKACVSLPLAKATFASVGKAVVK
jgi:hypothetical protein